MGRIHVLDAHVVNQIAAGEVIERPASVVKELVENALDAGARRIEVFVEGGGADLIEVVDDGWGIEPDDLERVFVSHATSKVAGVEDLLHIGSLGFRGEALASIGSVARVRVTSRTADSDSGAVVEDLEGRIGPVAPAGAAPGTRVRVEGLFHHVPARRKFLRSPPTELGHIRTAMGRFALAFPEVTFRLHHGGRLLLEATAPETRLQRIATVHGRDVADALLGVQAEDADLGLEAHVGPPSLHRGDSRLEQTWLNGRHVRDRTIAHAVRQAYDDLMPPGHRRPVAFLFLTAAPERVDVNVHPAKAEVRWRDGSAVHRFVRGALRRVLEDAAPGVPLPMATGGPVPGRVAETVEWAFTRGIGRPASPAPQGPPAHARTAASAHRPAVGGAVAEPDADDADVPDTPAARTSREGLRPVGQALGTYLVLESEDGLVLVDQHALHERVLFDRINDRLRARGRLEVQRLLVPTVVPLAADEIQAVLEAQGVLERLGFEVEAFGEDAVAVHGVPAVLRRPDAEAALREVLELLSEGEREGLDTTALVKSAVDRMACRAAVMAGDTLHADEVLALLDQAEALNHAHSCPHGRPTRLTLTKAQLERWFHRTV